MKKIDFISGVCVTVSFLAILGVTIAQALTGGVRFVEAHEAGDMVSPWSALNLFIFTVCGLWCGVRSVIGSISTK